MSDKNKKLWVSGAIALSVFGLFNFQAGYLVGLLTPSRAIELLRTQSFWLNELGFFSGCALVWFILYRSTRTKDR